MNNKILYQTQILELNKNDYKKILHKKVKLFTDREDVEKSELVGTITKVNLETVEPHRPFDLVIENVENNSRLSIGIIAIKKIEFI